MEIKIVDKIDDKHMAHYWYGGQCAVIKYKGYTFSIEAIGDIAWEYLKGETYEYGKDKSNSGRFYEEMDYYLKDDDALYNALENDELVFGNNNWWECFVTDPEGNFHDIMWALDSVRLDDAIEEVKESLDEIIEQIKEDD
jgi:hypothetical protein